MKVKRVIVGAGDIKQVLYFCPKCKKGHLLNYLAPKCDICNEKIDWEENGKECYGKKDD